MRRYLKEQLESPEEDFLKFFIRKVHSGKMTAKVMEVFGSVVQDAFQKVITEMVSDKLTNAIEGVKQAESIEVEPESEIDDGIVTTDEEIEAYHIIRAIMTKHIPAGDVVYKDTKSYFSINYQGNSWKWLCRLKLTHNQKSIAFRDAEGEIIWKQFNSLFDLYGMEQELLDALSVVAT